MLTYTLPLVNWVNGTVMIGVFALVSVGLITMLLLFMNSGKKKDKS